MLISARNCFAYTNCIHLTTVANSLSLYIESSPEGCVEGEAESREKIQSDQTGPLGIPLLLSTSDIGFISDLEVDLHRWRGC